jgi:DNA polymerase-3 subunit delta'
MHLKNQDRVRRLLEKLYTKGKVPNALLFYGPPGVGKTTAALDFLRGILCMKRTAWGCGECVSCRYYDGVVTAIREGDWERLSLYEETNGRKVFKYLSGEHPDFVFLPPFGGSIRIDQIRALKDFAYIKPALSSRKAILIDDAHKLTKESANALLKVLEEPPMDTVFILVSQGKSALLPTVLSRTYTIEFLPLKEEDFYELLGVEDKKLYERSGGSYTRALVLREKRELLSMVEEFFTENPQRVYEISLKADKLGDEEKEILIDLFEDRISDMLKEGIIDYYRFEEMERRLSMLRKGTVRGVRFSLGLLSLHALWR